MKSMLCLSTNYDVRLTFSEVLKAARDDVKHMGQGETLRYELHVFKYTGDENPEIHRNLPYSDPWYRNPNTLLAILGQVHTFIPGATFKIFSTRYVLDETDLQNLTEK